MSFIWCMLFASNPVLLPLGLSGMFGKEAKEAAHSIAAMITILIVLLLIGAIVFGIGYFIVHIASTITN